MSIKFTGTTIKEVNHTTTNIDTVSHTNTLVFSKTPQNHIWVFIAEYSSIPSSDLGIMESSTGDHFDRLVEITVEWPPNNYPIGTTGAIWNGNTTYYAFQIQGE